MHQSKGGHCLHIIHYSLNLLHVLNILQYCSETPAADGNGQEEEEEEEEEEDVETDV